MFGFFLVFSVFALFHGLNDLSFIFYLLKAAQNNVVLKSDKGTDNGLFLLDSFGLMQQFRKVRFENIKFFLILADLYRSYFAKLCDRKNR